MTNAEIMANFWRRAADWPVPGTDRVSDLPRGTGWSRYVNWNQFTLTKLAPVVVVKVTYRVCVPVGTGDAVTAGVVAQVCQPPVPLTSIVANGVAVSEPILNWIVPISVPESAEAIRAAICGYPLARLTPVYSSQLPLPIHPTLLPPPVSEVACVATPVLAAA